MRLLSLWEPWATLMAIGAKRIETRSWATKYRGWMAIHASKGGLNKGELKSVLDDQDIRRALGWKDSWIPFEALCADLKPGHIVAVTRLVDCRPTEDFIPRRGSRGGYTNTCPILTPEEEALGDYSAGRFGWVTESRFRLPEPIPYKAAQGLRTIPDESVLNELRRQFQALKETEAVQV